MQRTKNIIKKTISLTAISGVLLMGGYWALEPTLISAAAVSDPITVTQAVTQEITIDSPANVNMSASIPGVIGNPGAPRTGSATWTVKTTNATGFYLGLKSQRCASYGVRRNLPL